MMEFLDFAHRMADKTGNDIRKSHRLPKKFITKSDGSPVTEFDKSVEMKMRQMIQESFPGHGIIGEEFERYKTDADLIWVIDPIDGTKAFIAGIPVFGTLISLTQHGIPILGMIDHPITGDRWVGGNGIPTSLNGQRVQVRPCSNMSDALFFTSSPDAFQGNNREKLDRLRDVTKWAVYGGSCYSYGMLATGALDIGIDQDFSAADFCALVPVIQNAGGSATDWRGNELTIDSEGLFLATGDIRLHEAVLKYLN